MLSHLKKLVPEQLPLRKLYHKSIAVAAALRFRMPAKKMHVIGVTGTDGKTTTTFLIMQLLRLAGKRVGMASTVAFQIGDEAIVNTTHKTTLGRFGLQRLLAHMRQEHVTHAVLEVSSHALEQSRVWGIPFKTAVFTNLSREHLDYHRTMQEYFGAKKKLFQIVSRQKNTERTFILNGQSEYTKALLELNADKKILFTQGKEVECADYADDIIMISHVSVESDGQSFDISLGEKTLHTRTNLIGNFNLDNIAAAIGAVLAEGVSFEEAVSYIPQLSAVPGRMEVVDIKKDFSILIDYAVTPEALKKCYTTLKEGIGDGKLIAVLGACGDRDQGKRGEMGDIATTLCDHVIFTDEEPYSEDPLDILHMLESVAKGKKKTNYEVIQDRRKAILAAMQKAQKGDMVIVTGMGDQTSRVVGDKKLPWSDREVIREEAGSIKR